MLHVISVLWLDILYNAILLCIGCEGAQEEVDYEEQLHFSDGDDDEGKGTSNRGRTGREVWGDGQSEIQRSRTAQSVPNQALPHRALPHHTLHPPRQGLPPPRQGLPPPRQGLPTPRQGLPPPRQGLPPSRQTLPLPLPQQDPPQSHPAQPCQDPPHQGLLNQAPSPDNSAHIKPIEPPLSQGLMQNLVPNQIPNDDLATSPQISSDPCLVAPLLPVPPLDSPSDVSLPPPPGASDSAWRFRTRCVDAAVERARHRREVEEKEREEVTRRACQLKLKRLEDRERERRSELGTQSEMESVPETPKVTIIERNNGSLKESEKMNSKELELVPDEQVVLESENRELNEEKAVECERDFGFEADVVKQDEHSANVCEIIQSTEIQQLMVEETRWEKVECGQQKELGAEVKTVEDDKIDLLDERQNVQEREREREEIKKPEREKVLGVDWRMGVRVNELENEQGMDEIRLTGNMESVRSMNEWQHGVCEKHEIGRDVWKEIESKNLGKARERCWDGNKGIERVTGTGKGEEREKFVQESKEETKGVQERLRDGEEDLWRKKVHVEGDTDRVNEGEIMKVESWRKREVVETDLVRERKAERGDRGRVRMGEFIRDGDNDRRQVWRERTREVDWEKKAVLDNEQRRGKEYIRKGCEPNGVVSEAKDRDNVWNERFHDVKRLKKEGSKGNEAGIETDAAGHRDRCGVVGEEIRELKDINSIEAMQNHGFGKNEREVKTVRNLEKWNEKMRKGQVIKDGEEDEMSEGKINREEFPRGMKGDGQREKGTEERKGIMETEVKTQSQLSTEIIDEKEGNDKMYGFQQQPSSTLIPQKQHQRAISKPTQYQHSFDAFHSEDYCVQGTSPEERVALSPSTPVSEPEMFLFEKEKGERKSSLPSAPRRGNMRWGSKAGAQTRTSQPQCRSSEPVHFATGHVSSTQQGGLHPKSQTAISPDQEVFPPPKKPVSHSTLHDANLLRSYSSESRDCRIEGADRLPVRRNRQGRGRGFNSEGRDYVFGRDRGGNGGMRRQGIHITGTEGFESERKTEQTDGFGPCSPRALNQLQFYRGKGRSGMRGRGRGRGAGTKGWERFGEIETQSTQRGEVRIDDKTDERKSRRFRLKDTNRFRADVDAGTVEKVGGREGENVGKKIEEFNEERAVAEDSTLGGDKVGEKVADQNEDNLGDHSVEWDGHRSVWRGGDRSVWRGGDRSVWRGGDRSGWRGGDRSGWRGGDRSVWRGGDRSVWRGGDRSVWRGGDRSVWRGGDRSVWRGGDRTGGRGGDRAGGRGGDRAGGRGGDRAEGRGGDRMVGRGGDRAVGRGGDRAIWRGDQPGGQSSGHTGGRGVGRAGTGGRGVARVGGRGRGRAGAGGRGRARGRSLDSDERKENDKFGDIEGDGEKPGKERGEKTGGGESGNDEWETASESSDFSERRGKDVGQKREKGTAENQDEKDQEQGVFRSDGRSSRHVPPQCLPIMRSQVGGIVLGSGRGLLPTPSFQPCALLPLRGRGSGRRDGRGIGRGGRGSYSYQGRQGSGAGPSLPSPAVYDEGGPKMEKRDKASGKEEGGSGKGRGAGTLGRGRGGQRTRGDTMGKERSEEVGKGKQERAPAADSKRRAKARAGDAILQFDLNNFASVVVIDDPEGGSVSRVEDEGDEGLGTGGDGLGDVGVEFTPVISRRQRRDEGRKRKVEPEESGKEKIEAKLKQSERNVAKLPPRLARNRNMGLKSHSSSSTPDSTNVPLRKNSGSKSNLFPSKPQQHTLHQTEASNPVAPPLLLDPPFPNGKLLKSHSSALPSTTEPSVSASQLNLEHSNPNTSVLKAHGTEPFETVLPSTGGGRGVVQNGRPRDVPVAAPPVTNAWAKPLNSLQPSSTASTPVFSAQLKHTVTVCAPSVQTTELRPKEQRLNGRSRPETNTQKDVDEGSGPLFPEPSALLITPPEGSLIPSSEGEGMERREEECSEENSGERENEALETTNIGNMPTLLSEPTSPSIVSPSSSDLTLKMESARKAWERSPRGRATVPPPPPVASPSLPPSPLSPRLMSSSPSTPTANQVAVVIGPAMGGACLSPSTGAQSTPAAIVLSIAEQPNVCKVRPQQLLESNITSSTFPQLPCPPPALPSPLFLSQSSGSQYPTLYQVDPNHVFPIARLPHALHPAPTYNTTLAQPPALQALPLYSTLQAPPTSQPQDVFNLFRSPPQPFLQPNPSPMVLSGGGGASVGAGHQAPKPTFLGGAFPTDPTKGLGFSPQHPMPQPQPLPHQPPLVFDSGSHLAAAAMMESQLLQAGRPPLGIFPGPIPPQPQPGFYPSPSMSPSSLSQLPVQLPAYQIASPPAPPLLSLQPGGVGSTAPLGSQRQGKVLSCIDIDAARTPPITSSPFRSVSPVLGVRNVVQRGPQVYQQLQSLQPHVPPPVPPHHSMLQWGERAMVTGGNAPQTSSLTFNSASQEELKARQRAEVLQSTQRFFQQLSTPPIPSAPTPPVPNNPRTSRSGPIKPLKQHNLNSNNN
uniref:uncharacterized protein isoform X2 n=1 Tax=Myxine glutinosa TaxID=7769 RepID=UPI00358F5E9C